MTANITFTGLGTGTDWAKIVDQLVQVESYRINQMNTWKTSWQNKITSIQGLNSRMLSLDQFVQSKNTSSEFMATTATSSNTSVLTATSSGSATPGAHSITVGGYIPDKLASQGFASPDSLVGDSGGDMIIYVGTTPFTIPDAEIDPTTTLTELMGSINTHAGGLATAEILNDGSSQNPYRLVITATSPGASHRVSVPVANNPTDCQFLANEMGAADNTNVTGTATATSLGDYTGTISDSSKFATYTFTNSTGDQTVGSGTWNLSWSRDKGGNGGTVSLGSDYKPGNTIEIEDGVFIQVAAGTMNNNDSFTVKVFNKDVDTVQNGTWGGTSTVTSGGNYTGSTNKTFNFSVLNSGTLGADEIGIHWTDTEGNSGVITIPADYTPGTDLEVTQGVKISLAGETLVSGDTFSIDVYSPHVQMGQDSGLAQVEQVVHSGFIDPSTTPVTSSNATFSYIYGGKQASVFVSGGTTLSQLVNLINSDTANPGVSASILNDGLGLSTSYHLVLTGKNTGAPYTLANIQDTFTGGTFSSSNFSIAQEAQNSMLKVDGYPPDASQYIQRSSNLVSDVIPGTTLSLVAPGTTTVNVSADTNALQTTITTFVNSINFVLDYIKQETKYDATTKTAGTMLGNYSYEIVQQKITDILISKIPGLTDGIDPYTTLAQIGIRTDPDTGKWVIDSTTLNNALLTNLEGVQKLFVKDETTGTKNGVFELLTQEMANLDDKQSGPLNVLLDNYDGIISNIDKNIETEQKRVDLYKQNLQNQFTRLETLLGQLTQQQTALTNFINQLNGITPGTSTSSTGTSSSG